MKRLKYLISLGIIILLAALLLGSSVVLPSDQTEQVRAQTRNIEFDYITWTLDALQVKLGGIALGAAGYLPAEGQRQVVYDYLDLVVRIQGAEAELNRIYSDPAVQDPLGASADLRLILDDLYRQRLDVAPLAEEVLQGQISAAASGLDLALAGQALPPVLYHSTPLPLALIVSPREVIRQDENISLIPDLTVDQQQALEEEVDAALNVSSLVVGIGGVGVYPTMVMQTSDLGWITEVVAHEWVHNFLTLRPLGVSYLTSPELRTMNETAASIAGVEIGHVVMQAHYPELLPPPVEATTPSQPVEPPAPPPFDFRAEMRTTRVTVDQLLAEGKIEEAEQYMEERRIFFWEYGYRIRKLNQAYFAFHGAYADQPGGAAGEDPVGAAVRELRLQSSSLAEFLNRISWMWSSGQLKEAVGE